MKKFNQILFFILGGSFLLIQTACNKVEYPNVIFTEMDTTIYPGNFAEYDFPEFEENTNTMRNVLLEDYTGHQCPNCPTAATVAHALHEENPEHIYIASIHTSAANDGLSIFQEVTAEYPTDFTNAQGVEMGGTFFQAGVGFYSNPAGTINRFRMEGEGDVFFFDADEWGPLIDSVLAAPLNVNIQAESNYFEATNGAFLHVETDFVQALEGTYNIVVYAIENKLIAPQKMPSGEKNSTYEHHDIHRGNLFEETWGRQIAAGSIEAGTKIRTDFSYRLPEGLTNTDMHFLVFVYNRDTYQIEQVIKHEF